MKSEVLVIRTPSGLSGDMIVAGFCCMAGIRGEALQEFVSSLSFSGEIPSLIGLIQVEKRMLAEISGFGLDLNLPHEHAHRTCAQILEIISASGMNDRAKELACETFKLLALAEGEVHGKPPEEVTFHEVGALDSILDICLACALFVKLDPERFICSPLPVCDGTVACAHGLLSTPTPAVLNLLSGIPIYGIPSRGETVTPTAVALLKTLGADFAPWPQMKIKKHARIFGERVLPGIPNGAIFAIGEFLGKESRAKEHGHSHFHVHHEE